ncbi:Beta-lactamase-like protein [Kalmanozyma brasiliensis GHG001]|uniref:Beta-lactamase-like protein n=1 Tax=Kalmanozyma brasiliensis (strain GHG001) TaxID=1365824 RepID=UPI0028682A46|nr:Beta-lactamase-like protein [Kalmanozyma brasiliensis GHG001]EST08562.2 Beta-lactamase-like protein [Kalmanozyma brasiliensis GHG001]
MCFDTCVTVDSITGSKHIPASARVDPSSLPFHALSPGSDAKVTITLFHLGSINSYRQAWADDTWDADKAKRLNKAKQPVELPVLSALIEHEPTGERWLWDLGMSNDPNVLPKVFSSGAIKFMAGDLSDRGQLKNVLLKKFDVETIEEIGLSGIILSHAHVDHYGNLLDFPTSLPVFVGPGTMDWVGGGEDAAEKGEKGLMSFPSSFLKDRTFVEMDSISGSSVDAKIKDRVKSTIVGPFDQAWDWFGDGSIIIASAEGHCHGHMVLLAKTTSSPKPTYVLLSADAAHQQALYHPLPPPLQLNAESLCSSAARYNEPYASETDQRATPGYFDRTSAEAAMRTLAALSRMEACADVMVVLAHEIEFVKAVGLQEGSELIVNDWHAKGYKNAKIELGRKSREDLAAL